jgi:hypothetical protein
MTKQQLLDALAKDGIIPDPVPSYNELQKMYFAHLKNKAPEPSAIPLPESLPTQDPLGYKPEQPAPEPIDVEATHEEVQQTIDSLDRMLKNINKEARTTRLISISALLVAIILPLAIYLIIKYLKK